MARGLFWRNHLGQARLAPLCLGWVGWQNSECGWFSPVFFFGLFFLKTTQKFSRDLERNSRDLERIAEIWRDPIFHVFSSHKFMNPQYISNTAFVSGFLGKSQLYLHNRAILAKIGRSWNHIGHDKDCSPSQKVEREITTRKTQQSDQTWRKETRQRAGGDKR